MSDTCYICGGPHWSPDCSEFAKELKNLKFAYAYGVGPKHIQDLFNTAFMRENVMDKLCVMLTAPEGYEFTGEIRQAVKGEFYYFLNGVDEGRLEQPVSSTAYKYPILRPKWEWPEWLKAKYIAMDQCGIWYAFDTEPRISDRSWRGDGCYMLSTKSIDFTSPTCTDWKQSLRKNPNA